MLESRVVGGRRSSVTRGRRSWHERPGQETWTWPLRTATVAHRLEILADGLPLFGGAQLAVNTTLVSPIRGNGPDLVPRTLTGLTQEGTHPFWSWSVPDPVRVWWSSLCWMGMFLGLMKW